jgi:AcrR family transcriptional regulator
MEGREGMTEAPSKREQVREERRRQILEAAVAVFSQKGFHATNVSDVAAQAGVSQGTIYWYFDSKEELFEAALMLPFIDLGEETFLALAQCQTATEKLRALVLNMEDLADEVEGLFTLFLGYWASSPDRLKSAQVWVDLLVVYKDVVVAIIEEGVGNGEFKPTDADSLAWALIAAYDGLAAYTMLMPDLDLKRVSQAFVEVILNGLLNNAGA